MELAELIETLERSHNYDVKRRLEEIDLILEDLERYKKDITLISEFKELPDHSKILRIASILSFLAPKMQKHYEYFRDYDLKNGERIEVLAILKK